MFQIQLSLIEYFESMLNNLHCLPETKAYLINIFSNYRLSENLSDKSITIEFAKAREQRNFIIYQNLGDFIFYSQTLFPSYLNNASKDYYNTIARLSYYSCYKIVNGQMKIYEELADNFIYLENQVKKNLKDIIIK